jgi:hypothetical protein
LQDLRDKSTVYHDVLLRDVDNSGLAGWSGQIDGGQLSRAQATFAIENSVEAHTLLVQDYYKAYLGRPADPSGLATCVNALGAGATDEQVQAFLLGSPEYLQRNGNTTSGFLSALYLNVFGRQIDPSGDATFTAQLNAGVSRQTVALEILSSKEYYTRRAVVDLSSLPCAPRRCLHAILKQEGDVLQPDLDGAIGNSQAT